MPKRYRQWLLLSSLLLSACHNNGIQVVDIPNSRTSALVKGAFAQIGKTLVYDPSYAKLHYPGGDVPLERGVCTDVIIRAMRYAGVDLQVKVHEDMRRAFSQYPRNWGSRRPDPNIDHRRVPNLRLYFERQGKSLPVTYNAQDYQPGDIVTWRLENLGHIGILSNHQSDGRLLVIHNVGEGTVLEDALFAREITGHYRFFATSD